MFVSCSSLHSHSCNIISPSSIILYNTNSAVNMKLVAALSLAGLAGLAAAQHAAVLNSCADTIYVQSFPYDGSSPGPLTSLDKGKYFTEQFRSSGSVRSRLQLSYLSAK